MGLAECKEKTDSEDFAGWKAWFRYGKGGPRTPDNEIDDVLAARALSVLINANRTGGWAADPRDLLIYPQEATAEEIEGRVERAKAVLKSYLAAVAAVTGRKKRNV